MKRHSLYLDKYKKSPVYKMLDIKTLNIQIDGDFFKRIRE